MSSRELAILQEIEARLGGAALGPNAKPTGLGVDRYRTREVAPSSLPWMSVYPLNGTTERKGSTAESTLEVRIASWGKATAPVAVDEAMDALYLWATQQLMADESLGGRCLRIDPIRRTWSAAIQMVPFGDLDLHFLITYRHSAADPSRP